MAVEEYRVTLALSYGKELTEPFVPSAVVQGSNMNEKVMPDGST